MNTDLYTHLLQAISDLEYESLQSIGGSLVSPVRLSGSKTPGDASRDPHLRVPVLQEQDISTVSDRWVIS